MKISMIIEMRNPQSNGKLIAAEMMRQHHEVQIINMTDKGEKIIDKVSQFKPDVVFGTHTHRWITPEITQRLKALGPLMVLWYVDGYSPLKGETGELFKGVKGLYDLALVSVKGLVPEFFKMRFSRFVTWVPQYFDDTFFVPSVERTDEYDVCYLGNLYPAAKYREKFIEALQKRFKVKVGGVGFGRMYYGLHCANFYMQSKIAIDIPSCMPRIEFQMSDRIYRGMGLGCLFLSQNVKGLEQMFSAGVHLDVYDNTVEGLCAKVEYYLEHPRLLKRIAIAGQKEVMKNHTIGVRVRQYLAAIQDVMRRR